MINTLKHAALLVTAIFMVATPAYSQAPTDAQRNAIRSECRADYQAHCASVPPGGEASLQCLQKNMSSLSSGCQSAVRAVEPAAAPKAETAPAAAPKASAARRCCPARPPQLRSPQPQRRQRLRRLPRARRRSKPTMRRLPRSAAPAAPTIRRSAPVCRPEALRRCNAWKRTRQRFRRPARRPSTRPAAVQHLQPAAQRLSPVARLQQPPPLRPRSSCCGRCGRAKNCSS